ncbi:MAG: DUF2723 domain-containing protein [Oligoflexia bacterium]|nr:DUF2723 domain-containing protein [Oligoflexia bacterium]MBF0365130.1 DUF2723 domain-containing protein [Oligoflexia bacterium]
MASNRVLFPFLFFLLFIMLFPALLYYFTAAHTIQANDSSELLASAVNLQVAHPPGFPLFSWLYHLPLTLGDAQSVAYRGSLFTAFLALLTLLCLFKLCTHHGQSPLVSCLALLPLATSHLFWKYAIIPEVFMLNNLIIALFFYLYFTQNNCPLLLTIIFALGMCNHHTTIFLLPPLLHAHYKLPLKKIFLHIFVMATIVALFYYSLLLLHPNSRFSWGLLQTPLDIYNHFLRKEYGSFQLHGHSFAAATTFAPLPIIYFFFQSILLDLWPTLLLAVITLLSPIALNRKILITLLSFVLYLIIFFSLSNLPLTQEWIPILERFFLFPMLLLVILACIGVAKAKNHFLLLGVSLVISTSINLYQNFQKNDYSQNTIIEDYAKNLMAMIAVNNKTPVIIANNDTQYFSLLYLQAVLKINPHALIFSQGMFFDLQLYKKLAPLYPKINFPQTVPSDKDILKHFIIPNLAFADFYLFKNFNDSKNFKLTFLPLARKIEEGSQLYFDESSRSQLSFRHSPSLITHRNPSYFVEQELFSEYAYFYLAYGKHHGGAKAIHAYKKALALVPYCLPALTNLCILEASNELCTTRSFK